MSNFADKLKGMEPSKKDSPFLHTLFDGFFTFLYAPNHTTGDEGVHVRDGMDLKRTMIHVVLAMQLCYLFGTYNIGHQHFVAIGEYTGFMEGIHLKLAYGLVQILPIFVVANVVGLAIEFWFAAKKGHGIEEGYLVSGALIPLIMPPSIPLWILAISVAFAVIIGKEAFGGTGMNILNVALLCRAFIFFAYPTTISGDEAWVAGLEGFAPGSAVDYSWVQTGLFNSIFEGLGWATYNDMAVVADGYTGATPLILAANGNTLAAEGTLAAAGGWEAVTSVYSPLQMFWGAIPGSIGESSKPLIIVGILILLGSKIASWRIMFSMFLGLFVTGLIMNAMGTSPFMTVPWYYHIYMGSFLFAMAFMATDPVTAASTNTGKWVYGFMIGMVGMIIRVWNPAYPEGWMLAILFMNVFAPLIDHMVLDANVSRRMKRGKKALENAVTSEPTLVKEPQH